MIECAVQTSGLKMHTLNKPRTFLLTHHTLNIGCMKEILTALKIWIGANSNLDTNHDIPVVLFLTQEQMEHMYYGEHEHEKDSLHGLYDTDDNVIILLDTWDRRKPWDLGVLLHEMVHYLQDQNDIKFACMANMERDAWPLQQKYLSEKHGVDWQYDDLWHHMISTCRDGY